MPRAPFVNLITSALALVIVTGVGAIVALVIKSLQELIYACQSASRASIQVEIAAQSIVKACASVEATCRSVDRNILRAESLGEQASDVAERFRDLPSTASRTLLQLIQEEEEVSRPGQGSVSLGATIPGKMSVFGWLPEGKSGPRLTFSARNLFSPVCYPTVSYGKLYLLEVRFLPCMVFPHSSHMP
eukprot:6191627-Pyramimonas_sp.AAC.1